MFFSRSDLNRVCSHFKLDSRALLDTIKVDSQSRVSFSELHYAIYQETRLSPSMQQMPAPQPPPAQPPSHVHYHPRQPPPSSHNRRMSSHNLLYDYNIPFDETDDSFTPPKYTPDDYNQEVCMHMLTDERGGLFWVWMQTHGAVAALTDCTTLCSLATIIIHMHADC